MNDEDALVARAATGDTAAFRALYGKHRGDVARLVYRMLGARSDLDDVIQEVFFQVYKSLKDFRGNSKFSTWLHRVPIDLVLGSDVDPPGRFIQDEQVRVGEHPLGEDDLLLVTP